ncbi:SNARE complex subunit (Bet1), putative [Talaromyces stipitatus ATCC 10500]|uniref:SNARE complex subunit (Bet1), putative n=1 Tax=Talaromyces stipitatus (strain ATCC 10500 / CBS 375.48 / QM 6759 / NRRL 1006) TaxID=441959 RepID=B8MLC8_TALSN|nr:SNARE complex subunit (Bet1), putative [Talaromyces stipitatus ATCC 10500]EED15043.1 SNARE complex subunit (Bet1), putative [Talaromyces stipitatus ATCC 10500]
MASRYEPPHTSHTQTSTNETPAPHPPSSIPTAATDDPLDLLLVDHLPQTPRRLPIQAHIPMEEAEDCILVVVKVNMVTGLRRRIRGHYSDAVLSELESQNDHEVEGITAKVKALKELTVAIGDEIRSSSNLADSMNEAFDNTRLRLRGTMNRMLRMAERTGVGWKVWLGFFLAVVLLFAYVWLF